MEITYMLQCDNCKSVFESEEAFPERQLCPRCLIVFNAGLAQGRKEVVKWLKKNIFCLQAMDNYCDFGIDTQEWHSQLAVWGIKEAQ